MNAQAVARRTAKPPEPVRPAAPPSAVRPVIRASAPGRRRRNGRAILAAFALCVGLPTLLATIYFGLIASPLYVSEASITIRSSKQQATSLLTALGAGPADGVAGATETQLVADYLRSRDAVANIEREIGFRRRYATFNADFLSRLEPDASNEEMYGFFQKVVRVTDDGAGLLTLSVKAFTPDDAVAIASSAIGAAEAMVNRLSESAQTDALRFARAEVEAAEARLISASESVTAYRKKSGDLDPRRSAEAVMAVIAGLEGQLATARIRLAELRSYLKPDSPTVSAVNSKIAALKRQIGEERRRLAANDGETLTEALSSFESERLQLELAETAYKSALAGLEAARVGAQNDRSYLVAYAPPSLPDVAAEPKRLYKIATAFVVSLLAFGVGALVIGAVREHARA